MTIRNQRKEPLEIDFRNLQISVRGRPYNQYAVYRWDEERDGWGEPLGLVEIAPESKEWFIVAGGRRYTFADKYVVRMDGVFPTEQPFGPISIKHRTTTTLGLIVLD